MLSHNRGGKEDIMTRKIGVSLEFKYEIALKGWCSMIAGFLYVIREEFDAATALKLIEKLFKRDDRVKNLTNNLRTIFKIEGNDAKTMLDWFETFHEILGTEYTIPEQSKTIFRQKITKCPFKTGYKDVSEWCKIWSDIVYKTINPKAIYWRGRI
jgi:hypothetical protein